MLSSALIALARVLHLEGMERGVDPNQDRALRLALLGEVAGEAAHELRNALAVIGASAELLRGADPARVDHHIAKIQRNARLAQDLIDTLMAIARGEPVRAEPVLLTNVLAEARRDLDGPAAYVDDLDPTLGVRASPVLLSRLFRVLYENAIQASAPRTPKITTRAHAAEANATTKDALVIDVADDGPGIPEAIRADLFEPLVSHRPGGTGLGLALARRAARAHSGELELASSEAGACFRLRLPLSAG